MPPLSAATTPDAFSLSLAIFAADIISLFASFSPLSSTAFAAAATPPFSLMPPDGYCCQMFSFSIFSIIFISAIISSIATARFARP
jgi:hypothetical protein